MQQIFYARVTMIAVSRIKLVCNSAADGFFCFASRFLRNFRMSAAGRGSSISGKKNRPHGQTWALASAINRVSSANHL